MAFPEVSDLADLGELPDQSGRGQRVLFCSMPEFLQRRSGPDAEPIGPQCVQSELVIVRARGREGSGIRLDLGKAWIPFGCCSFRQRAELRAEVGDQPMDIASGGGMEVDEGEREGSRP